MSAESNNEQNVNMTFSELLRRNVLIPRVQRGYVQGLASARELRERFIRDVLRAASADGDPITLYFIYGKLSEHEFLPLDGQQRLTTLLLVMWYYEKIPDECKASKSVDELTCCVAFSYESRRMARRFVQWLLSRKSGYSGPMKKEGVAAWIRSSSDFVPGWEGDSSVSGMIATLESIEKVSKWFNEDECFDFNKVTFRVQKVSDEIDLGETYLKINARGEPLTSWENVKSILDAHARRLKEDQNAETQSIGREWLAHINGDWVSNIEACLPRLISRDLTCEFSVEDRDSVIGFGLAQINAAFRNIVDLAITLCVAEDDARSRFHEHVATYEDYRNTHYVTPEALRLAARFFSVLSCYEDISGAWEKKRSNNSLWNPIIKGNDLWRKEFLLTGIAYAKSDEEHFCNMLHAHGFGDLSTDFSGAIVRKGYTYSSGVRFALIASALSGSEDRGAMMKFALARALNILDNSQDPECETVVGVYRFLSDIATCRNSISNVPPGLQRLEVEREMEKIAMYHRGITSFVEIESDSRFAWFKGSIAFAYDKSLSVYSEEKADFFANYFMRGVPVFKDEYYLALMSYVEECKQIRIPQCCLCKSDSVCDGYDDWRQFFYSTSVCDAFESLYNSWKKSHCAEIRSCTGCIATYLNIVRERGNQYKWIDFYGPWSGSKRKRVFVWRTNTMKGVPNYNLCVDFSGKELEYLKTRLGVDVLSWDQCGKNKYLRLKGSDRYVRSHDILNIDEKNVAEYIKKEDGEFVLAQ